MVSAVKQEDTNTERNNSQTEFLHRSSSINKNQTEFFPVHTTPDPLTGTILLCEYTILLCFKTILKDDTRMDE